MLGLKNEDKNKKIGISVSVTLHAVLLIILLGSFLTYPDPPPGQEGILVSFGTPDLGEGDDMPDTQQEEMVEPEEYTPPEETVEETVEEEVEETVEEVIEEIAEETAPEDTAPEPAEEEIQPTEAQDVETSETAEEIAIKKAKEAAEQLKKEQEEREAASKAKKRAEEIAKKKAEDAVAAKKAAKAAKEAKEAKEKAEADAKAAKEYSDKKKQYGDLFGKGKGNKGKPGNSGDPNGDPNSGNLDGISTGQGNVGGGLGDRGLLNSPKVSDTSQETGKIVLKVCVDSSGRVIRDKTKYTGKGSTSSNTKLIAIAIKNANRYKFTPGDRDTQCGTITYDFKVK